MEEEPASSRQAQQEWLKTSRSHLVTFPNGISPYEDRHSTCYVLNIVRVKGLSIPQLKSATQCELRYMLTLFHKEFKFFGRTYTSTSLPLSLSGALYECDLPEYVIFYSAIPTASLQAVVELVVRAQAADGSRMTFSVGWCPMEVTLDKKDLHAELFEGSPRLLLQSGHLQVIKRGTKIEYQSIQAGGMDTFKKLLPANCLCGPHDTLPGLLDYRLPRLANTLLSSAADSRERQLLPSAQLYINSCAIKVPAALEHRLLESISELIIPDYASTLPSTQQAASKEKEIEVTIYEARLKVGSHNQWTYVNGAKLKNSIVLDSDRELLRCNGIPVVDSVFCSSEVAVVFQLEYSFRVHRKGCEDETIGIVLGEYLCLPRLDGDSGQFEPTAVTDRMITDSDHSVTGALIWTFPENRQRKEDCEIVLMCEVSPFQGNVHGASTDSILATIQERKRIEDVHKKQLKEIQERDKMRTLELEERAKELERKSRRISTFAQRNQSMKLSDVSGNSIPPSPISANFQARNFPVSGQPRGYIKTPSSSLLSPKEQPLPRFAQKAEIIKENREEEEKPEGGIIESIGREIPRGDQALLSHQAAEESSIVNVAPAAKGFPATLGIEGEMKASTIFVEFVSFQPGDRNAVEDEVIPKRIAFSFRFFDFPLVRTEAVKMVKGKDDRGEDVFGLKLDGNVLTWTNRQAVHADLGLLRLEFDFDPASEECKAEDEHKRFAEYLSKDLLKIWLWDADTQIPFASCKLSLIDILRSLIEPLRTVRKDCDVISEESEGEEVIGRLNLMLQNVGRKEGSLAKAKAKLAEAVIGGTRAPKRGKTKVKSRPLTVKDLSKVPQMSKLIQGEYAASSRKQENDTSAEEERRKAELVYAYKAYVSNNQNSSQWSQESLVEDYGKYRSLSRAVALSGMIELTSGQAGPFVRYRLGETQLRPVTFVNPYAKETAFSVMIYDPEARTDVQLVTGPTEWKHYCAQGCFAEPPDWTMLTAEGRFLLKQGEKVVLIFRILGLSPPTKPRRNVTISILHDRSKSAEQACEIGLAYKESHFDGCFMFNEPEKRSVDIALPPESHADVFRKVKAILCSDPTAEVRMENSRVFLTVATPSAAEDSEICTFLYSDQHFLEKACAFHVLIRAYSCIDINEVAGKRVSQALSMSEDSARGVKVVSGNGRMVRIASAVQSAVVSVSAAAYKIGKSKVLVHGIDMNSGKVLRRWMFRLFTHVPPVSAEYEVQASAQENSEVSFAYQNLTSTQKVYEVNCSSPAMARVVQPMLVLPPGEKGLVKLQIFPPDREREAKVYVFVTDTSTGRSEAFYFLINYGL